MEPLIQWMMSYLPELLPVIALDRGKGTMNDLTGFGTHELEDVKLVSQVNDLDVYLFLARALRTLQDSLDTVGDCGDHGVVNHRVTPDP